eukprot:5959018-Pyramimonas_sp.AAC.1
MLQIHQRASRNVKTGGDPRWKNIIAAIGKNQPLLKNNLEAFCSFVQAFSGGEDPIFLRDLNMYSKSLMDNRKQIPPATFKLLAGVPLTQSPEWIISCVKACMVCPEPLCRDGQARLLSSADTAAMTGSKKAAVTKAVCLIRAAKRFLAELGDMSLSKKSEIMSTAEVRMVMHVHNKRARGRKEFSDLGEICEEFMVEVIKAHPAAADVAPPWERPKPIENNDAVTGSMRSFTENGLSSKELVSRGFVVNALIQPMSQATRDEHYIIEKIEAGIVALKAVVGGSSGSSD